MSNFVFTRNFEKTRHKNLYYDVSENFSELEKKLHQLSRIGVKKANLVKINNPVWAIVYTQAHWLASQAQCVQCRYQLRKGVTNSNQMIW